MTPLCPMPDNTPHYGAFREKPLDVYDKCNDRLIECGSF